MKLGRRRPVSRRVGTSPAVAGGWANTRPGRDVGAMSPKERLAELGGLLALSLRRLSIRQKALDGGAEPEALCDQAVDGDRAAPTEEVA